MKVQSGFHNSLFWRLKKMKSSFENPTSYQTVNCFLVQPQFFRTLVISSLMDWILDLEDERLANSLKTKTHFSIAPISFMPLLQKPNLPRRVRIVSFNTAASLIRPGAILFCYIWLTKALNRCCDRPRNQRAHF